MSSAVDTFPFLGKVGAFVAAVFIGPLAWLWAVGGHIAPNLLDSFWMFGIIDGICVWLVHPFFKGSLAGQLARSYFGLFLVSVLCGVLQQALGLGFALPSGRRTFHSLSTAEEHLMLRAVGLIAGAPTVMFLGLITALRKQYQDRRRLCGMSVESAG